MTPDEARTVLVAARAAADFVRWQEVIDLLEPVHRATVLAGTEQGEIAYHLGHAYAWLGRWDAAEPFLDEALATAAPDIRTRTEGIRSQALTEGVANLAEEGGVASDEAAMVLAAGATALDRMDYGTALSHYRKVYDSPASQSHRAAAALGIGRACAWQAQLVEAAQYAGFAADQGDATVVKEANELLAWISSQQDAAADALDGVTPDEFTEIRTAAQRAFYQGSFDYAMTLYLSILEGQNIGMADRAQISNRLGICYRIVGDDAAARSHFEFAAAHGDAKTVTNAQKQLEMMSKEAVAEELVAALQE